MSNEEAIEVIEETIDDLCDGRILDLVPVRVSALEVAIESLKQNQWTPCNERMPEEYEWMGTKQFGTTISDEVYVTFESPDGVRFTKHLCFQNGKLSNHDQLTIDAFHKGAVPIAWMPLPEPWKGEEE